MKSITKNAIVILLVGTAWLVQIQLTSAKDTATPSVESPKSAAAIAAIQKFERARTEANATYRRAIRAARTEEVSALDKARQLAMKSDQLPDAVRIDAVRKEAQDALAADSKIPAGTALDAAVFAAVWRMPEFDARVQYETDGRYHCDKWSAGKVGEWKAIDANSIMQYEPDGTILKTTFTVDRKAAIYQYMNGEKAGSVTAGIAIKPGS